MAGQALTVPAWISTGTGRQAAANQTVTFDDGVPQSASPTAKIGYATGAGATVTQLTNRSTGVTINATCGAITTDATSLAAGAEASFVVTNSAVEIGDVVVACARSGQTATTSVVHVIAVANGSFTLQLTNLAAATADTGAMVINFAVIKAVSA